MTIQHYQNKAKNAEKIRVKGHCPREKLNQDLKTICTCAFFRFKLWKKQRIYTNLEKLFLGSKFFQVFSRFFPEIFKFQVFPWTFQGRLKIPGFPRFSRCVGTLLKIYTKFEQSPLNLHLKPLLDLFVYNVLEHGSLEYLNIPMGALSKL